MNAKKVTLTVSICIALLMLWGCQKIEHTMPVYNQGIHIIPIPAELTQPENSQPYVITSSTQLVTQGNEANIVAEFIASKMRRSTGYSLKVEQDETPKSGNICLSIDPKLNLNEEGYTLHSDAQGVQIVGKTAHGLWNGAMTLLQLLPAEIESEKTVKTIDWLIPAVGIQDEPRFTYRGMHLDPCRHFLPVEDVKRQLDVMALFKINRMHWHLTDDQGWRIEIKKYPKLTEVGSKRIEGDGTEYGGFYTQEEIKEIVAYATERFITIVPEIEMPGHAMAALSAYPELACKPRSFEPRIVWGVEDDVFCAGKEEVFAFIEDVLTEVTTLFPGEYFHIGGDECPKIYWKECPLCQKRIREEKLKDEHELQSYFIRRVEQIMTRLGKKIIGWDEILEGGLAPTATVMSWRGEEGGIAAARQNHHVIMTPNSSGLYLDYYQGDSNVEPVGIGGYYPLETTYGYDPLPKELAADKHHYILGAQGNLWSEYFYQPADMEYHAYPRILALAELTWSPAERKDFADFCRRWENAAVRLDLHHVNYHIPLPEQPNGSLDFIAFTDSTQLELTTTRPIKVVYTTDGTEPTAESPVYEKPITIHQNTTVKTASVMQSGKLSRVRSIVFEKQTPSPAVTVKNPTPGLKTETLIGDFLTASDLPKDATYTEGHIRGFDELIGESFKNSIKEVQRKAVIATGYLRIPEDGVYYFCTENDQFFIDDILLIDNGKDVKRFSRHDSSRALRAGLHPIRVIWVGSIIGGWPSHWNDGSVRIKKVGEKTFQPITPEMLF